MRKIFLYGDILLLDSICPRPSCIVHHPLSSFSKSIYYVWVAMNIVEEDRIFKYCLKKIVFWRIGTKHVVRVNNSEVSSTKIYKFHNLWARGLRQDIVLPVICKRYITLIKLLLLYSWTKMIQSEHMITFIKSNLKKNYIPSSTSWNSICGKI